MRSMRLLGLLVCLLIILPLAGSPALAQTSGRTVTATARCVEWSKSAPAHVEVVLTNNSGLPISLSYLHGWTTSEALNPTFLMRDPGETVSQSIQDGDTLVVQAPWDDLRRHEGDIGMAIVITSTGVLMPICDGREAGLERPLGPKPTNGQEAVTELATIAAETIGVLETWRAYPALYALLHPDAQAEVSFRKVACWYAGQYRDSHHLEAGRLFHAGARCFARTLDLGRQWHRSTGTPPKSPTSRRSEPCRNRPR